MKVLFVATVYRHLTTFHIPYMKLLQAEGYEVWAAGIEEENEKTILMQLGIKCVDIPFSRSPVNFANLIAIYKMKKELLKTDFEFIHVHTPIASFITRFVFRNQASVKLIYSAHGFHFYKGSNILSWILFYPLESFSAKWTDILITTNYEDYHRAFKMGYKKNSIHYIPGVGVNYPQNYVDESWKVKFKQDNHIIENAVIISYIAELNINKNHMFLLDNWNQIKKDCPNATLLIIGDGVLKNEISKKIEKNNLLDVKMLGYRKDVEKILSITHIVSLLSKREGLPKSIMEAMANKLPCVVSNTRGLRDLIEHNENGFVVNLGNNNELLYAFKELLLNQNIREKMGNKSYGKIENYHLDRTIYDHNVIYKKIIAENAKEE